jgi:hypothetical protein
VQSTQLPILKKVEAQHIVTFSHRSIEQTLETAATKIVQLTQRLIDRVSTTL